MTANLPVNGNAGGPPNRKISRLSVDSSPGLSLALCSSCPSYRGEAGDRAGAWRKAAAHAELVHEDPKLVKHAQKNATRTKRG